MDYLWNWEGLADEGALSQHRTACTLDRKGRWASITRGGKLRVRKLCLKIHISVTSAQSILNGTKYNILSQCLLSCPLLTSSVTLDQGCCQSKGHCPAGEGLKNEQSAFSLFSLSDLQLVFPVGRFHLHWMAKEAYLDVGQSPSFQRKRGM